MTQNPETKIRLRGSTHWVEKRKKREKKTTHVKKLELVGEKKKEEVSIVSSLATSQLWTSPSLSSTLCQTKNKKTFPTSPLRACHLPGVFSSFSCYCPTGMPLPGAMCFDEGICSAAAVAKNMRMNAATPLPPPKPLIENEASPPPSLLHIQKLNDR